MNLLCWFNLFPEPNPPEPLGFMHQTKGPWVWRPLERIFSPVEFQRDLDFLAKDPAEPFLELAKEVIKERFSSDYYYPRGR